MNSYPRFWLDHSRRRMTPQFTSQVPFETQTAKRRGNLAAFGNVTYEVGASGSGDLGLQNRSLGIR